MYLHLRLTGIPKAAREDLRGEPQGRAYGGGVLQCPFPPVLRELWSGTEADGMADPMIEAGKTSVYTPSREVE